MTQDGLVFYIHGEIAGSLMTYPFEFQFWTTVMYHCFEFEHDRFYKKSKESLLLAVEKELQAEIDKSSNTAQIFEICKKG